MHLRASFNHEPRVIATGEIGDRAAPADHNVSGLDVLQAHGAITQVLRNCFLPNKRRGVRWYPPHIIRAEFDNMRAVPRQLFPDPAIMNLFNGVYILARKFRHIRSAA